MKNMMPFLRRRMWDWPTERLQSVARQDPLKAHAELVLFTRAVCPC